MAARKGPYTDILSEVHRASGAGTVSTGSPSQLRRRCIISRLEVARSFWIGSPLDPRGALQASRPNAAGTGSFDTAPGLCGWTEAPELQCVESICPGGPQATSTWRHPLSSYRALHRAPPRISQHGFKDCQALALGIIGRPASLADLASDVEQVDRGAHKYWQDERPWRVNPGGHQ